MYTDDAVDKSIVIQRLKHLRGDNSQENKENIMTPCKFHDDKHRCG